MPASVALPGLPGQPAAAHIGGSRPQGNGDYYRGWRAVALGLFLAVAWAPSLAQSPAGGPASADPAATCPAVADDRERLACFDRAYRRAGPAGSGLKPTVPAPPPGTGLLNPPMTPSPPDLVGPADGVQTPKLESVLPSGSGPLAQAVLDVRRSLGTSLADRWELEPDLDRGRFVLRPYKPMYALVADGTTRKNAVPRSPNLANTAGDPLRVNSVESKFQISLKTKVFEDIVGDNGDIWLGYTQSSYWQIYNVGESRPFREANYEPEVMAVFRTDYSLLGWNGRLAGISLNHQSNGRSEPLSRSWNRIIAQFGFERKNWMAIVRPWWRLPEAENSDDNPDISDFMGRADLLLVRKSEGHELSLLLRHSLRSGNRSHGAVQLDYAFPITSYLKAYVQLFNGYGASLIDYNHRQTRLGIGISLVQWL